VKGSIRQRGENSWELRVFIGRDPVSGRVRYATKSVRGGKREAQRALAAMVSAAPASAPISSMTVADTLERWFDHARDGLSPSTVANTRMIIDKHLGPHIGAVPLSKLTPERIDAAYRALRDHGGRGGKSLAPATVHRAHNVLHRAVGQAVRWGWLPTNPVSLASPPRRPAPDIRPPAPAEVMQLFAEAAKEGPAFALYVLVAAVTGARRGELIALRWSDVDFDAGVVQLRRGIVHGITGLAEKDTKTHTARRIAVDAATIEALRQHRSAAEDVATACGAVVTGECFVFSYAPDGRQNWSPALVTQAFARVAKRAGVPEVRLHDLRHFVATRLLSNGVDVRTVAGRLGHRNPNVTLNVYAHFLPEADRDAADLLGRLLAKPTGNVT